MVDDEKPMACFRMMRSEDDHVAACVLGENGSSQVVLTEGPMTKVPKIR